MRQAVYIAPARFELGNRFCWMAGLAFQPFEFQSIMPEQGQRASKTDFSHTKCKINTCFLYTLVNRIIFGGKIKKVVIDLQRGDLMHVKFKIGNKVVLLVEATPGNLLIEQGFDGTLKNEINFYTRIIQP